MQPNQVRAQFGATAEAYATSQVHAAGRDLPRLVELARPQGTEELLDVSTGAGHTALAFAPRVRHVVATDLTPGMLAVAQRLANERGQTNVTFREADAHALPFADQSFDLVTCRVAAHHYHDLGRAVAEMARVLRPGGRLVASDTVAPDDEVADRFINALEKLRDPSHVRDYRVAEWQAALARAGLQEGTVERLRLELDFGDWVQRSATPAELVAVLSAMLTGAPPRLQEMFVVGTAPLRFSLHKAIMVAVKA